MNYLPQLPFVHNLYLLYCYYEASIQSHVPIIYKNIIDYIETTYIIFIYTKTEHPDNQKTKGLIILTNKKRGIFRNGNIPLLCHYQKAILITISTVFSRVLYLI